ncbi:MAG: TetR/AcrR family transcriptional regulator [Desulfobacter sp.]|nr:MAG: TetR/AcrR family transcriptional regulator [Desulfobacter sp.]
MRVKDEIKQEALFQATVAMVNETGFAASSVSKIAKAAKVSPATLYVYHKNKEELLVSTYVRIKELMSRTLLRGFNEDLPIRDCLQQLWMNTFAFASEHPAYFQYMEQFANSPYSGLVDKEKVEAYFAPMFRVMTRGIEQKILKDVEFDILAAFMFYPVKALANPRFCTNFELTDKSIETAFNLAWDAVKR